MAATARPERTGRFNHPELDQLRFVAFLAVFVHHAFPLRASDWPHLPASLANPAAAFAVAGGWGVDLFFALSSYLITELLLREFASRGTLDVRAFYIRRALRIWPLYYVFLALTVVGVPRLVPNDHLGWAHGAAFTFFAGNWSTAILGYPASVAALLWSVSVEEQFYVAWPIALKAVGLRHLKRFALGLLAVAWLTRIWLVSRGVPHPGIWTNTFARLDPIAGGALVAVLLEGRSPTWRTWTRFVLLLGGFALPVTAAALFGMGAFSGPASLMTYPIAALAAVLVLVATIRKEATPRALGALAGYLGKISYGLYVYHMLALALVRRSFTAVPALRPFDRFGIEPAVALPLTIALAAASYRYLESPFLRLKQRFAVVPSRGDAVSTHGYVVSSPTGEGSPPSPKWEVVS
jgi:peptidoglycan/LPS O-acetylase OafA/YrhL